MYNEDLNSDISITNQNIEKVKSLALFSCE